MNAALIYDGSEDPIIPSSMGSPRHDQLVGTPFEKLGELAGRICYDSLGQGRTSAEYHKHIIDVINLSVYEHLVFTVIYPAASVGKTLGILVALLNRKGTWIEIRPDEIEITVNYRTILEWDRHTTETNKRCGNREFDQVKATLQHFAHLLAPQIMQAPCDPNLVRRDAVLKDENLNDNQAHITLWLYGSRGFTHEQVRHRFAISQRSTRYVDEDGSPYIEHPLVTKWLSDGSEMFEEQAFARNRIRDSITADRLIYKTLVNYLMTYCVKQGMDKTSARKQARGAARGYLGNALASEMLFTASVSNWQWILKNRKNKAADAEIRAIYTPGLKALQSSRYGSRFQSFSLIPSPDGIGEVLA